MSNGKKFIKLNELRDTLEKIDVTITGIQSYYKSVFISDIYVRIKLERAKDNQYEVSIEKTTITEPYQTEQIIEGMLRMEKEILRIAFNLLKAIKWNIKQQVNSIQLLLLVDIMEKVWVSEIEKVICTENKNESNALYFLNDLENYSYYFKKITKKRKELKIINRRHLRNRTKNYLKSLRTNKISTMMIDNSYSKQNNNESFDCLLSGTKINVHIKHVRPITQENNLMNSINIIKTRNYTNPLSLRPKSQCNFNVKTTKPFPHIYIVLPETSSISVSSNEDMFSKICFNPYCKLQNDFTNYNNVNAMYKVKRRSNRKITQSVKIGRAHV